MSHRRTLACAVALFLLAAPQAAQAQDYPTRSVKFIVPFGLHHFSSSRANCVCYHLGSRIAQAPLSRLPPPPARWSQSAFRQVLQRVYRFAIATNLEMELVAVGTG